MTTWLPSEAASTPWGERAWVRAAFVGMDAALAVWTISNKRHLTHYLLAEMSRRATDVACLALEPLEPRLSLSLDQRRDPFRTPGPPGLVLTISGVDPDIAQALCAGWNVRAASLARRPAC